MLDKTTQFRARVTRWALCFTAVLVNGGWSSQSALADDSETIVLGMSAAFTGQSQGLGSEYYDGARVYFESLTDDQLPAGLKIRLHALDDGYEPGPAVSNTLQLMADPDLLALFGYVGTPTATRVLPLLRRHNRDDLLLFFPFTGARTLRTPPYGDLVFNLRASYADETAGLVERLLAVGRKRIGVFYQADAYGRSGWVGVREALRERGLDIAAEATYRRGSGFEQSFKEQVELLREVDAVVAVGSYEACAGFIRDAREAELALPIANVSFVGAERLLERLTALPRDGVDYTANLVISQVLPSYDDESLPAVQEYREAMASAGAESGDVEGARRSARSVSYVSFEGFLSAKLMAEVLRRAFPSAGESDSDPSLRIAAESIVDFDLGLGVPVGFGPTDRAGLEQIWFTTVRDGKLVGLDDWTAFAK